jgi:hypothetical protein
MLLGYAHANWAAEVMHIEQNMLLAELLNEFLRDRR